jgi:hypothetical protein
MSQSNFQRYGRERTVNDRREGKTDGFNQVAEKSETKMARSPLFFNLCLKPLFEAIKRNENIQRASMRTKEEPLVKVTVQGYVDDVIVVAESEDGVVQMF